MERTSEQIAYRSANKGAVITGIETANLTQKEADEVYDAVCNAFFAAMTNISDRARVRRAARTK